MRRTVFEPEADVEHRAPSPPELASPQPRPRSRWLRLLLPLLVLAASLAGFAYLRATREPLPPVQAEERAWLVQVVPVSLRARGPQLLLYGQVSNRGLATLSAAVAGDVQSVLALEGEQLRRGALLVELDPAELRLELAQREAELADARAQIESENTRHGADLEAMAIERRLLDLAQREASRIDDLVRRNLASATQRDQARAELERAELALVARQQAVSDHAARLAMLESRLAKARAARDRAALDLQRSRIEAPFDGRVVAVAVAVGDRVVPGSPLVELIDDTRLEVRALIPSARLATVRAALNDGASLAATAQVDGAPVALELRALAARSAEASGGVDALFRVTSESDALAVGRVLTVILDLPAVDDVAELPFEALYGLDRIYRIEDDERMYPVPVRLVGERYSGDGARRILVTAPELAEGDQVVSTQLPNAVTGLRVRIAGGGLS